jgi:hypothetical protein
MNPRNPRYYHTPPQPVSTRARCPVCHEEVYSRAGIHPQCAVRQADPPKVKGKGTVVPDRPEPAQEAGDQPGAATVVGQANPERNSASDRPPV